MKRSITSAIVAGALLAGVACSGGGVAPQSGPKIQLTTPKSVSPALIKAPPMVLTAVLPASAMISRRPATAIEPQSWAQIPGSATQVAAAADGSLWVLSDQPAGPDKAIWHYVAGTWTNIPGAASQISVAPNGTLNVINSAGGIYAYSGGTWTSPGGGAKSITTLVDNSIVVVSSQGSGDQGIWRNDGSGWQQLGGSGVAVYAGEDTVPHTVGGNAINPNGVYILNNAGQIYYENSDSSFAQLPESASSLASRPGGVFAVASGALGPNGNAIYYFDLDSPGWTAQTGTASSLSVGANNVLFAVSGSGAIYQTNTDSPTPVPTPTATPTATPTPTPTATPTATPTPANTLAVNPNPISLLQTGASTVGVTEAGFSGSITAVSSDTGILTVASSPVTMTAGTATINVTAVASGSTTLTVSDGAQTVLVPVHVTITGVIIGTAGHR